MVDSSNDELSNGMSHGCQTRSADFSSDDLLDSSSSEPVKSWHLWYCWSVVPCWSVKCYEMIRNELEWLKWDEFWSGLKWEWKCPWNDLKWIEMIRFWKELKLLSLVNTFAPASGQIDRFCDQGVSCTTWVQPIRFIWTKQSCNFKKSLHFNSTNLSSVYNVRWKQGEYSIKAAGVSIAINLLGSQSLFILVGYMIRGTNVHYVDVRMVITVIIIVN